jgi:hypothetical protein
MSSGRTQRGYYATIGVLLALALGVPARYHFGSSWFADKIQLFIAPVARPTIALVAYLRGERAVIDDARVRTLVEENERLRREVLRLTQESQRLQRTISDLQGGLALNPDMRARQLLAPVYGATGSQPMLLRVQAGRHEGIGTTTIALAPGLQLIGRIVDVGERTSTVQVIVSPGAGQVEAVVIVRENSPDGLRCVLRPTGHGTLAGPVEDKRDTSGATIEPLVGQPVRLDDPTWPRTARMVLLGHIEAVDPNPDQPLRKIITVRPTVSNPERLSELILWVPLEDAR